MWGLDGWGSVGGDAGKYGAVRPWSLLVRLELHDGLGSPPAGTFPPWQSRNGPSGPPSSTTSELDRARFRAEGPILASPSHPDIARLVDGGAPDHGLPYLRIEQVDAPPFARRRGPPVAWA